MGHVNCKLYMLSMLKKFGRQITNDRLYYF